MPYATVAVHLLGAKEESPMGKIGAGFDRVDCDGRAGHGLVNDPEQ